MNRKKLHFLRVSVDTQHGAALVTGLVVLLMLTVFGLSSVQISSLEERMAGNARRKDIAFHAAETALRGGEEWLRKQNPAPSHSVFNCQSTSGLYLGNCGNTIPLWDALEASNTWATQAIQYIGKLAWVTNNPSYIVEEIQHGGILNDNLEVPLISPDAVVYRITARGVGPGASPDSVAIVQSTFKKPQQ